MSYHSIFKKALLSVALIGCNAALAAPLFQAGDIERGGQWPLNAANGVVSYFAAGREGIVQFTCELQGEVDDSCGNSGLQATLRPGKNFVNVYNPLVVPLHQGTNGPFNWQLSNNNEEDNVGNIKINYMCGKEVTVQCVGKKI